MTRSTFLFAVVLFCLSTFSQNCDETFSGEGTFYGYGGGGNCSFPAPTSPVYTGAMNELQYDSSMTCGACVEVTGNKGSLVIRIEDRCPECKYGDIDLSEEAFPLIDDKIKGRVPITWKFVPCPVQGAVKFYFKEGSSQWWTAVQVRNHKYPVTKFEYKVDGQWVNIPRKMYNYFVVESPGMGPGPYSFRITDMYGDVIEENNIPLIVTTEIKGQNQFPDCNGSSYIPVTGVSVLPASASTNALEFYPNPFKESVNIEIAQPEKVKSISVYDQLGRLMLVLDATQISTSFTLGEELNTGSYILKLNTEEHVQTYILNKIN